MTIHERQCVGAKEQKVLASTFGSSATTRCRAALTVLGIVTIAASASAQAPDTSQALPWDVAGEAAYRYNLPASLRAQGATVVDSARTVDGNVAVRDGQLTIRGVVHGNVTVINGSAVLAAGARVDSDVFVVGGRVRRDSAAGVGGAVRAYAFPLTYRMQGDQMIATHDSASSDLGWFKRWQAEYDSARTKFALRAGTYDRVEGLPVMLGLAKRRNPDIGQFELTALGIYRSVNSFAWTADNLGYDITASLKRGKESGMEYGVRFQDDVAPAEDWQVSNAEIFLYSFGVRDDMRDYYESQGGSAWARWFAGSSSLQLRYAQSWWTTREAQNPISLLNSDESWRANPALDAGLLRAVDLDYRYDTRNIATDPWSGWLIDANAEVGWTDALTQGTTSPGVRDSTAAAEPVTYGRGWLDVRRYDRVSPQGHLNFRLVFGTQLGEGPLPLERRFSMGGPGSLPGYAFRQLLSPDVFTCSDSMVPSGQPAQCDRMLLAQLEFRADFTLRLFRRESKEGEAAGYHIVEPLSWVVFTDGGRGWLTGAANDGLRYGAWTLPPLYTFRTDLGAGVDLGWLGLYGAKSLTDWGTPMRFVVRLQHRF